MSSHKVRHRIEDELTESMWKECNDDLGNSGLGEGKPCIERAAKAYKQLIKEGRHEEAAALQTVILNKSWNARRLSQEGVRMQDDVPHDMRCPRCGHEVEDEWHRYWRCPDNVLI